METLERPRSSHIPQFRIRKTIDHLDGAGPSAPEKFRNFWTSTVAQGTSSAPDSLRFSVNMGYDYKRTTAENYSQKRNELDGKEKLHFGKFAKIRAGLDYSYHPVYNPQRQRLQDSLIANVVCKKLPKQEKPWVIFTAGAMGAGKTHTVKWLSNQGYLPLESMFVIDPDEFKKMLPEWDGYVEHNPLTAGDMTHLESSLLMEVTEGILLQRGCNINVDGSLRDWKWYQYVFTNIKKRHPQYRIAILYVYASPEVVYERIDRRAKVTGRLVPRASVEQSFKQVPESIEKLRPYCDVIIKIDNSVSPKLTHFANQQYPAGWDSPSWFQIKSMFPSPSESLQEAAKEVVNRLLETKVPILFSRTYCTWCDRAKEVLQILGVKYQVCELNQYEPSELVLGIQAVLKSLSGTHTVPQLYFNQKFIGNFDTLRELYLSEEILNVIPTELAEGPLPALDFLQVLHE